MEALLAALFGFIGGLARAFVGLLKNSVPKQIEGPRWLSLTFTILASGFIGLFCGLLLIADYRFSLLAGYAGTDLIENIYKIRKRTKIKL